jgi:hypothetical protein
MITTTINNTKAIDQDKHVCQARAAFVITFLGVLVVATLIGLSGARMALRANLIRFHMAPMMPDTKNPSTKPSRKDTLSKYIRG